MGSNHGHGLDCLLDRCRSIAVSIGSPYERVRQPLIGSNHMHLMERVEGDQAATLIERHGSRATRIVEAANVLPVWREGLESFVVMVRHQDAAVVVDTDAVRSEWLAILQRELEQELKVTCRKDLHAIVLVVGHDDAVAMAVECHASWLVEQAGLIAVGSKLAQERTIDRRQHLNAIIEAIDDEDPISLAIDRDTGRITELERALALLPDLEHEPELIGQRPNLDAMVGSIGHHDVAALAIDRDRLRIAESARSFAIRTELANEATVIGRERLHAMVVDVDRIQQPTLWIERHTACRLELGIGAATIECTKCTCDSMITIHEIHERASEQARYRDSKNSKRSINTNHTVHSGLPINP